jgi:hypothetical protein
MTRTQPNHVLSVQRALLWLGPLPHVPSQTWPAVAYLPTIVMIGSLPTILTSFSDISSKTLMPALRHLAQASLQAGATGRGSIQFPK